MTMRNVARLAAIICLSTSALQAITLRQSTADAFNRYVQLTEMRASSELSAHGPYLYPDLHPSESADIYARVHKGGVFITRLQTYSSTGKLDIPYGMIHHWLGLAFIPHATLKQTLALVQNYNAHSTFYSPEVVRSRILVHKGSDFRISYRVKQHKVITVVLDTDYDVHYGTLSTTRAFSRSYSTRVSEVVHPGENDEYTEEPDHGTGFLWRLNTYWRFEQRDGGTYVQCEAVSLSRDIPTGLGWMIGRFVESVPRESLEFTLQKTRQALAR